MQLIHSDAAPAPIGPYSQGYTCKCGLVFLSGQLGCDPATGVLPDTIEAQADLACKNVSSILTSADIGFEQVVKTTCFLADMADFSAFNQVYAKYFVSKPARSCVAVRQLPKGALCEIEVIAEKA